MSRYVCPRCDPNSKLNYPNLKKLNSQDNELVKKMFKAISGNRNSQPFKEPVDPKINPKYYEIVKEPMGESESRNAVRINFNSLVFRSANNRKESELWPVQKPCRVHRRYHQDLRELQILQPSGESPARQGGTVIHKKDSSKSFLSNPLSLFPCPGYRCGEVSRELGAVPGPEDWGFAGEGERDQVAAPPLPRPLPRPQ